MNILGKHIAILVDNYFEQAELEEPLSTLKDAGAEVTVIAISQSDLQAMQHAELGDKFTADLLINQASTGDYDALVLPGGVINADSIRVNETAQRWVQDFLNQEKPLAVICHAPWLLISADVLEGRKLTSYETIRDDIVNAGGEWINRAVVIDGCLITSRQPDDIPQFNDAIISMLQRETENAVPSAADMIVSSDAFQNEDDQRLRSMGYDKRRDEITRSDEREILAEEDETDPDESKLSDLVANSERGQ